MTNKKARIILKKPKHVRLKYIISLPQTKLILGDTTRIMGIVNVTPDSFSKDGCLKRNNNPVSQALKMIKQGADIIDIGGESSRPGAHKISIKDEITRVIPTITKLAKKTIIPISIDSYKPDVAKYALDAGASIVNNIMGSKPNKPLLRMVKAYNAGIILMHIRGNPQNMQKNIQYSDIINEICESLRKSVEICLEIGIKSDKIIIDPGIGFGKTVEHNLKILNCLNKFRTLRKPLLIGTSRKSFIGKVLKKQVEDRLIGTLATVTTSILRGTHIVRVHDVLAAKQTAIMADAIISEKMC